MLIYLIKHDGYGAAKVGIGDMAGSRLAQHRREGWQLLAAFQVAAKAGRVDLAATVVHVCELALSPEARPTA